MALETKGLRSLPPTVNICSRSVGRGRVKMNPKSVLDLNASMAYLLLTGVAITLLGLLVIRLILSNVPEGTSWETMRADYRLESTKNVAEGCPKIAALARSALMDDQVTESENDKVQRALIATRAVPGGPMACPVSPARSYRIAAEQAQRAG